MATPSSVLRLRLWPVLAVVLCAYSAVRAGETTAESRIVAAGLFKNGLAVIKRDVKIAGPGEYVLGDLPDPVHGTWWVEADTPLETRATMRWVEEPPRGNLDLQRSMAGRKITVHFRDGQIPPASGTVETLPAEEKDMAWDRSYQSEYYRWYCGSLAGAPPQAPSADRFLLLKTETGRIFLEMAQITYLRVEGDAAPAASRQRKPVLILTAPPGAKAGTARLTYLTKGLSWAPSYRVDTSDAKTLVLTQEAIVKNEMGNLEDAELQLITGFPNMPFAHVVSPLSPRTNLATFFQQLSQRFTPQQASMFNVVSQQRTMSQQDAGPSGLDLSASPGGEGVDLHYQSVGKRTLKEGDSLAFTVAGGKADYERIVEWCVPDTRDEFGRFIEEYRRAQDPEKYADAAWDAVRFKNPLPFPMTTAVATVVSSGRFMGQTMSYFTNSGEETSLRVNKALSVRTRSIEKEEEGQREIVNIGGVTFRKVNVKGELTVNNHRKEDIKLVLRRAFSGELLAADGEPKSSLREEGVYSVNQRRELWWSFTLKPGEEKTLTYRYGVLVRH